MNCVCGASLKSDEKSEKGSLLIGGGLFDAMNRREIHPFEGRIEYRFLESFFWRFKPLVGIMATDKSDFYIHTSAFLESDVVNGFSLSGTFGAGFYKKDKGISLGSSFNFKSQAEVWYHFLPSCQVGIAVSHLSHFNNRSISFNFLGNKYNPGQESFVFQIKFGL